ncbi:motility associated factor glycosyltransferase family protein [Lysinibacillus fusiformis]|uniref:motility associated factor glycosyltransferase family protein n=1 Tax=Lysinibacillus fusiformis TaxID=28031 RepID=UPI00382131FD
MIIDANIDILTKNNDHWIGTFNEASDILKSLISDTENSIEYFENHSGEIYEVKDEYDKSFQFNNELKQIVFIIGINSIKEIEKLYKEKHAETYFIIIEPNASIFNYNLNNKDFSIFTDNKVLLFADEDTTNLSAFLSSILNRNQVSRLIKNSQIYITYYYRNFEVKKAIDLVKIINETTRNVVDTFGNDIKDNLIGLEHSLKNLNFLKKSRNPDFLRDKFNGKPAIVVAAGPSLNENIQYLKSAQGKAVIVAVDTIIPKLLEEGIIPDFVCSVERGPLVYEYFYKDKKFPEVTTLVGPLVLDTRVFESFKGEMLLPFRTEVNEFRWLQHILGIEGNVGTLMGMSCAHVAFGVANLLGCSPIVLTGQDLAYGESDKETHASGTHYDNIKNNSAINVYEYTDGYFGGTVRTTKIWQLFKYWYERKIEDLNLQVINATEGGAKINHTIQMSLKEVVEKYCIEDIPSVYECIKATNKYKIEAEQIVEAFSKEVEAFEDFNSQCVRMLYLLRNLEITEETVNIKKEHIIQALSVVEALIQRLSKHQLLSHNLQSTVLQYYWNINSVTDENTMKNLLLRRYYQLKVLEPIVGTISEIADYLKKSIDTLSKELED